MTASVTTVASFPTSTGDGTAPDGELFIDSNGDLRGATTLGGANGIGATYEVVKTAGGFASTPTFLADIPPGLNTLLGVPNLSADANGDLFGLEITGGANRLGSVVEFPAGGGAVTLPTTFTGGAGGSGPAGKLLVDANGNLFGITSSGGANASGTLFEIQKTGGVYATAPTILTSFGLGIVPFGSSNLVEDASGDLFGRTASSVFAVQKTGASSYAAPVSLGLIPGGAAGIGNITIDGKGDIFGTTVTGGANNNGSVFEIEKIAGSYGAAVTLASFRLADGQLSQNHPKTLIVDANGDLFGTTDPNNQNSGGVVYEIVKTGATYSSTPTIVHDFQGSATVGLGANLVADPNGNLFATTILGGNNNNGTVFEITGSGYLPPLVLTAGANASYVAGTAAVALDPGLSITGSNLTGATVSISAGLLPGDLLTAGSLPGGVTSSYNAGTGVLTLSGSASRVAYQAALDSVTFASAVALNPSSRTITWSGTDGITNPPPLASSSVAVFVSNSDLNVTLQQTSGQLALWQASGVTLGASALLNPNAGPSWLDVGGGSFFGADTSDILFQQNSGAVSVWQMQNNVFQSGNAVANPGPHWRVQGTGDFNADGHTDVLLQKDSGDVSIWEMNGNGHISQPGEVANPGPNWHVEGTGDFNQDGNSDIVLQNNNGSVTIWNMNGSTVNQSDDVANPGPSWHVVETGGDLYGDGKSDIVLQNNSGAVAVWEINSSGQISQSGTIANPGPSWHVVGTGDFNSDNKTDLVLQNNSGAVSVWDMNGSTVSQSGVLANPGPTWTVVGDGRHTG